MFCSLRKPMYSLGAKHVCYTFTALRSPLNNLQSRVSFNSYATHMSRRDNTLLNLLTPSTYLLRRIKTCVLYLHQLFFQVFFYYQVIDDKLLPVLRVLAHVVAQQLLDRSLLIQQYRLQANVLPDKQFKLIR